MWPPRGGMPGDEVRQTLPKLRRLLYATIFVSMSALLVQRVLERVEAHSKGSKSTATSSLVTHDTEQVGGLHDEANPDSRNRSRVHAKTINGTGIDTRNSSAMSHRRTDVHCNGLIVAIIGMMICRHEFRMQKRLFTFALFTFVNFAYDVVTLLQRAETPPFGKHLFHRHCPMPVAEIARYLASQQKQLRDHLAAQIPEGSALLDYLQKDPPLKDLPEGDMVDLCSPMWALSNMHLVISSVFILWMHIYATRMWRSATSNFTDEFGGLVDGFMGGGRVSVIEIGPSRAHRQRASFVPFTGPPRKLDF